MHLLACPVCGQELEEPASMHVCPIAKEHIVSRQSGKRASISMSNCSDDSVQPFDFNAFHMMQARRSSISPPPIIKDRKVRRASLGHVVCFKQLSNLGLAENSSCDDATVTTPQLPSKFRRGERVSTQVALAALDKTEIPAGTHGRVAGSDDYGLIELLTDAGQTIIAEAADLRFEGLLPPGTKVSLTVPVVLKTLSCSKKEKKIPAGSVGTVTDVTKHPKTGHTAYTIHWACGPTCDADAVHVVPKRHTTPPSSHSSISPPQSRRASLRDMFLKV
ncbi:hypothetical protein DIPPA_04006 [Diplonema papillatum]|nr:hypothetical protein DIPPA_04006 [Diplonema papillatum]